MLWIAHEVETFAVRGGRFGVHNIHENQSVPTALRSDTLIFGAFFNDVYMDEHRTICAIDRISGGLYSLELTV